MLTFVHAEIFGGQAGSDDHPPADHCPRRVAPGGPLEATGFDFADKRISSVCNDDKYPTLGAH